MSNIRPLKVFLCHASADKPAVRKLYQYLRERKMDPWLDAEKLFPGQNWQVEIPKALLSSDVIIVCLSRNSIDKEGYVQKEIKFALDKALEMPEGRIFLVPARLEECDLPYSLSAYHYVNLFEEDGYKRLLKSLRLRAEQIGAANVPVAQDVGSPEIGKLQNESRQESVREKAEVPIRVKPAAENPEGGASGKVVQAGKDKAQAPKLERPVREITGHAKTEKKTREQSKRVAASKAIRPKEEPQRTQERPALNVRNLIGLAIIAAMILSGLGYLGRMYLLRSQPVAKVGNAKITVSDFQARVRAERDILLRQYLFLSQSQGSGVDVSTQSRQLEGLLAAQLAANEALGQSVLDELIQGELIQQEAAKRGITVSDQEVEKILQVYAGYSPDGTPTPPASAAAAPTLSDALTPQAPPTPFTLEGYKALYRKNIEHYAALGLSEAQYRQLFAIDILRNKLYEEVTASTPRDGEQVHARHILVGSEDEALAVIDRLNAGEDFAKLASELSLDTGSGAQGGDLGWFSRSGVIAPLAEAAFSLKVGEISAPVKTDLGYHIIQVMDRQIRPLDERDYKDATDKAFQDFLLQLRTDYKVEIYDTWKKYIPTEPNFNTLATEQAATGIATFMIPTPSE